MSTWTKFSLSEETKETAYADTVGNATWLPTGVHAGVEIESVTPTEGYPSFDIMFANGVKERRSQRVYPIYENKKTGTSVLSNKYKFLGQAVCGLGESDSATEEERNAAILLYQKVFLDIVPTNPGFLSNLVGMKLNIRVGYPKRGFLIKRVSESIAVFDIETDCIQEHLSADTDGMFPTFEAAKSAIIENGNRVAYLEVAGVYPNGEFIKANREQLQNAVEKYEATKATQPVAIKSVAF